MAGFPRSEPASDSPSSKEGGRLGGRAAGQNRNLPGPHAFCRRVIKSASVHYEYGAPYLDPRTLSLPTPRVRMRHPKQSRGDLERASPLSSRKPRREWPIEGDERVVERGLVGGGTVVSGGGTQKKCRSGRTHRYPRDAERSVWTSSLTGHRYVAKQDRLGIVLS